MSVEQRLKQIIVEQLGVEEEDVVDSASFNDDLGADSLDTVEVIMAVEEEFEIEIPDEDAERLQSFGQLKEYVSMRVWKHTSVNWLIKKAPKRAFFNLFLITYTNLTNW